MAGSFHFELVSPERLLMSEDVDAVLVPGSEGEFEVLAGHAPFLSTLRPGLMRVRGGSMPERQIFVRGGFADTGPDGLTVLAEEAIPVEEIDREVIASQIVDAEEDVKDAKDEATRDEAERNLEHLRDVQRVLGHG